MLRQFALIGFFAGALFIPHPAAASCFQYGPALVTASGTISIKQYYGPPNYGEDPATDSKENFLFLALDSPLCVDGDGSNYPEGQSESGVKSIEMVYFSSEYPFQPTWLGKHVSVSGTLFHAISGHHHTAVLITVTETHTIPLHPSQPH